MYLKIAKMLYVRSIILCFGILQRSSRNEPEAKSDEQVTGYLMSRFRIYGRDFTFVNLCLYTVPFEDVNELIEQVTEVECDNLLQLLFF